MKVKEKEAQIKRIEAKMWRSVNQFHLSSESRERVAEDIFRIISRITHFQEKGEQRRTKKSRREIDAQIIANVGEALRVL